MGIFEVDKTERSPSDHLFSYFLFRTSLLCEPQMGWLLAWMVMIVSRLESMTGRGMNDMTRLSVVA
jgi:hypothetical protein